MSYSKSKHCQRTIQIIADHREQKAGVIEALQTFPDVSISIQHLSLGDYQIDQKLLFERKTLVDLTVSIKDGRLFRQACQLASFPLRSVYILEGTAKDLLKSEMRREAIQGALITLSVLLGIPILRAKDVFETARLMLYTAKQVQAIATGSLVRPGVRPKGKRKNQLFLLQGLPGVGPARAQRLLDSFGSVEAVMTATVQELQSIEGIGSTTAKAIRWVVNASTAQYGFQNNDPIL